MPYFDTLKLHRIQYIKAKYIVKDLEAICWESHPLRSAEGFLWDRLGFAKSLEGADNSPSKIWTFSKSLFTCNNSTFPKASLCCFHCSSVFILVFGFLGRCVYIKITQKVDGKNHKYPCHRLYSLEHISPRKSTGSLSLSYFTKPHYSNIYLARIDWLWMFSCTKIIMLLSMLGVIVSFCFGAFPPLELQLIGQILLNKQINTFELPFI